MRLGRSFYSNKSLREHMLHPSLIRGLEKNGIDKLTSIQELLLRFMLQEQSIASIYKHRSTAILSETGSGKTYAYGIPILNHLLNNPRKSTSDKSHGALIFTTTKELCSQIYASLKKLDTQNQLKIFRTSPLSYNFEHKKKNFESDQYFMTYLDWSKVDILISTPTQLETMQKTQASAKTGAVSPKYLVLDEFDQMLTDKKYSYAIKNTLGDLGSHLRGKLLTEEVLQRKFVLAGASMLKTIFGQPAKSYLDDHFPDLNLVQSQQFLKINPKIQMENFNVEGLSESDKLLLTKQLVEREGKERVLIFCHEWEQADVLARYLTTQGVPAESFHSKLSGNERADKLFGFEKGSTVCLVCTDLAARGIDFREVPLVLQFDYADNGINLLHRIGRTGRMGAAGKVISLVDEAHTDLYAEFTDAFKNKLPLDSIFSRNRSFNKKLKRRNDSTVVAQPTE